jgi:hypothetical protein
MSLLIVLNRNKKLKQLVMPTLLFKSIQCDQQPTSILLPCPIFQFVTNWSNSQPIHTFTPLSLFTDYYPQPLIYSIQFTSKNCSLYTHSNIFDWYVPYLFISATTQVFSTDITERAIGDPMKQLKSGIHWSGQFHSRIQLSR